MLMRLCLCSVMPLCECRLACIIALDGPHVSPYACLSICLVFLGYQHLKTKLESTEKVYPELFVRR